jgi:hypothetical protein
MIEKVACVKCEPSKDERSINHLDESNGNEVRAILGRSLCRKDLTSRIGMRALVNEKLAHCPALESVGCFLRLMVYYFQHSAMDQRLESN